MAHEIARSLRKRMIPQDKRCRNLEGVLTLIDDALRNPHPASLCSATLPFQGRDEDAVVRCTNFGRSDNRMCSSKCSLKFLHA